METPAIFVDVFLFALAAAVLILTIWIIRLEMKLKRFLAGKNAQTLEDSFMFIKKGVERQTHINQEIAKEIDKLDARIGGSIRGMGVVRFDAFKGSGSGGSQSFAVAFLDEHENGVVLSSLYGRDRFSAFAKPVQKGSSSYELSTEETEALQKAQHSLRGNTA